MRDCRCCQEVNASPPTTTRKSGVKLKLFSFFLVFRESGRNKARERAGGCGDGSDASAYVCVYIINEERARGGGAVMISGSEMSTKSERYSACRGLCLQQ